MVISCNVCSVFGIGRNMPVDGAILAEFLPLSQRARTMVSLSILGIG